MKIIKAGNGSCGSTNCWTCSTGGFHCTTPSESSLPEEEGVTCSWGICGACCISEPIK